MRYLSLFFACALLSCNVSAADAFTVQLEMKDGELIPGPLTVPANTRIRIEVHNSGNSPAEFESTQMRKEKVLAPGAKSVVVIARLRPGQYSFFDDFHLDHPAGLVIAE